MLNKIYFALILVMLPFWANAEKLGETKKLFVSVKDIVTNVLIPLVFTLALLFFFYGVAKYIWSEGTTKEEGRKIMIWGVIALFVMSSIWGLVKYIQDAIELDKGSEGKIPTIK